MLRRGAAGRLRRSGGVLGRCFESERGGLEGVWVDGVVGCADLPEAFGDAEEM